MKIGDRLPNLAKGPLTSAHIARWCAAQENWDRIHYDQDYARNIAGLRGTVINGALKQHFLAQFLTESFDARGWVWKLDFRFVTSDLVGEGLTIEGCISSIREVASRTIVTVDMGIRNDVTDEVTTRATGQVILPSNGARRIDALDLVSELPEPELTPGDSDRLPPRIRDHLGRQTERLQAVLPLEAGRLRLFADAVMGLRPEHHNIAAGRDSPWGCVVAPPLFPIHALVQAPGTLPLSSEPDAMGREGVAEIGRNMSGLFGIQPQGLLNGGSSVEVHSLLRVGEVAEGTSTLLSAKERIGKRGGRMMVFETLNEYRELAGRPLLTERQAIVMRLE